jgi:RNA polymerase sigma-70 factor (ECF subfamily)
VIRSADPTDRPDPTGAREHQGVARLDHLSDHELAVGAAAGDRRSLETLLARHADRIHAICRRVLAHPEDALDAAQEAMIAISRGIARFDGRSLFTTWLYRVTTNAALDEARRRQRRPRPVETLPEVAGAADLADRLADQMVVDAALAKIPPEFRAAVALRDLAGFDYAEIAEVLGIPPGTVRSRIARGRAALADLLRPAGEAATEFSPLGNQPGHADRQTPLP